MSGETQMYVIMPQRALVQLFRAPADDLRVERRVEAFAQNEVESLRVVRRGAAVEDALPNVEVLNVVGAERLHAQLVELA